MRPSLVALTIVVAAGVAIGQEVPNVVVERHWFHGDRAVRITLFDNKMAVTTVREDDRQVFFRQLTLGNGEYEIYIKAMSEVVDKAGRSDRVAVETVDSGARVTLNLPAFSPSAFSYSPLQVLDLPTARLVAVLDDLQKRVTEASPSQEALRLWEPATDDMVELYVGGKARVTEIRENGVLVMEQADTGIIMVVPREEWHLMIMRVLAR